MDGVNKRLYDLGEVIKALSSTAKEYYDKDVQSSGKIAELEKSIKELKNSGKEEAERIKKAYERALSDAVEVHKNEVNILKARLKEYENKNEEIIRTGNALKKSMEIFDIKADDLAEKEKSLKTEQIRLNKEKDEFERQKYDMINQKEEANASEAKLRGEISDKEDEIIELNQKIEKFKSEIESLKKEIENLEFDRDNYKEKWEAVNRDFDKGNKEEFSDYERPKYEGGSDGDGGDGVILY